MSQLSDYKVKHFKFVYFELSNLTFIFQKTTFPNWTGQRLSENNPQMDREGLDLLAKLLVYQPDKRITAKIALAHPYFKDVQIVRPPYM